MNFSLSELSNSLSDGVQRVSARASVYAESARQQYQQYQGAPPGAAAGGGGGGGGAGGAAAGGAPQAQRAGQGQLQPQRNGGGGVNLHIKGRRAHSASPRVPPTPSPPPERADPSPQPQSQPQPKPAAAAPEANLLNLSPEHRALQPQSAALLDLGHDQGFLDQPYQNGGHHNHHQQPAASKAAASQRQPAPGLPPRQQQQPPRAAPNAEMDLLGFGGPEQPHKPLHHANSEPSMEHDLFGEMQSGGAPPAADPLADFMGNAKATPAAAAAAEPKRAQSAKKDGMSQFLEPSPQPPQSQAKKPQHTPPARSQAQPQAAMLGGDDMIDMSGDSALGMSSQADPNTIPFSELSVGKKIGTGAFADVFLCEWRGTPCALKQLSNDQLTEANLDEFRREMAILSRLRHPNVMLFLGYCLTPPRMYVLSELCSHGTLFSLLHQSQTQLDTQRQVQMALDIARALAYLHGCRPPLVHRDIKSLNVLVDKHFNCKVSDFGLTVSAQGVLTQKCGTYQYMAPELFSGNVQYDEKVDVYAFGILLWELFCRELPFASMLGEQVPVAVAKGVRPTIPVECPSYLATVMQQCWDGNPYNRPTMKQVVEGLNKISERMTDLWR